MENYNLERALVPTNRELKEFLNNIQRLYARKLAAEMPPATEDEEQWAALECWTGAMKETCREWLQNGGKEWLTKRQLVMVLIGEAAALQRELTAEEK